MSNDALDVSPEALWRLAHLFFHGEFPGGVRDDVSLMLGKAMPEKLTLVGRRVFLNASSWLSRVCSRELQRLGRFSSSLRFEAPAETSLTLAGFLGWFRQKEIVQPEGF